MKRFIHIIFTGILISIATITYGQNSYLSKRTDINEQSVTIKKILKSLQKKTGASFSYNSKVISKRDKISLAASNKTLSEILKIIFKKQDVDFIEIDGIIILNTKKEIAILKKEQSDGTKNPSSSKDEVIQEPKIQLKTVNGYIKDSETGEALIGVNIIIDSLNVGATSNEYGFYSLTVPVGIHQIRFSYLGFVQEFKYADLNDNLKIDISLSSNGQMLDEVIVKSIPYENIHLNLTMSNVNVSLQSLNNMPSYLGETDLLKHLEKIPGVKSFGDGSTAYYVRGGNKGQNLIILDEAPIFNPTHLFGFYSSFIPDAVKDVKIYKGNAPSKFGGRLSSVVEIRTKDGNMKKMEGGVSLGPYTSKLQIETPIIKNTSSCLLALRKSNLNWLFSSDDPTLNFYDLNFKLNGKFNRHNFYLSFYRGSDIFDGLQTEFGHNGIKWSNTALTARWNYIITNKIFSNITLFGSDYSFDLSMGSGDIEKWNSQINTIGMKNDFTYYVSPKNTVRFGIDLVTYNFNPGNIVYADSVENPDAPYVSNAHLTNIAFYLSHEFSISKSFKAYYGFRLPRYMNSGESTVYTFDEDKYITDTTIYEKGDNYNIHYFLEPRINIAYIANEYNSVKASYSRNTQALHLITNSESPFTSLDVWLPISPNIKTQIADQYSIGYYRSFNSQPADFSIEFFYKKMQNQIDYKEHANMLLNPYLEGELIFGDGWAYGLEFLLKKEEGKLNGWLGYTLSKSYRQYVEIQDGEPFSAPFDRLHDLIIYASYKLKKRLQISGTWIYSSGAPYTEPTGFYKYQDYTVPIYTKKNNERLPDYHRLDLMLSFRLNKRDNLHFDHQLTFSIFNVYARKNPFNVTYNKVRTESGSFEVPTNYYKTNELVNTQLYLMTIVPSINYIFKIK